MTTEAKTEGPPAAMTVGELIDALSAYPRDERVLVENGEGWWNEIDRVEGPTVVDGKIDWDESDVYSLPTIFFGSTFDSRSL